MTAKIGVTSAPALVALLALLMLGATGCENAACEAVLDENTVLICQAYFCVGDAVVDNPNTPRDEHEEAVRLGLARCEQMRASVERAKPACDRTSDAQLAEYIAYRDESEAYRDSVCPAP